MFGQRAAELIRELERTAEDSLPPYKAEGVRSICEEMSAIFEANCRDSALRSDPTTDPAIIESISNTLHFRNVAMERNKRCLVAYHYNRMERLRNLRWSLGGIIPTALRQTLSENETKWFADYCETLTNYMMETARLAVEDDPEEELMVLDLTVHQRPPKEYYIEVRVLIDYGDYETQDGETVRLNKNVRLCLPRTDCEHLIRQGVLQHVQ